ncbi:MAG: hypothetical protein JWR00_2857 [Rubritepida sp.]|nr:hypothetical protein [Rubritepida sp.]
MNSQTSRAGKLFAPGMTVGISESTETGSSAIGRSTAWEVLSKSIRRRVEDQPYPILDHDRVRQVRRHGLGQHTGADIGGRRRP